MRNVNRFELFNGKPKAAVLSVLRRRLRLAVKRLDAKSND